MTVDRITETIQTCREVAEALEGGTRFFSANDAARMEKRLQAAAKMMHEFKAQLTVREQSAL